MNKENKPIFIHSLFRTGSTYIWNKFRQNKGCCCYYEPFHEVLGEITVERPSPWYWDAKTTEQLRHPPVEKDYLFEYKKLLRPGHKGVPFFKKSFSFDNFCDNNDNPDQERYIDYLVENSGDQIPVLQFNRSALRVQWFKRHYPGMLNIYIVRNPRDQFQSYLVMQEINKLDVFLAMDLQITGINLNCKYFKPLAARIPLFEYHFPRAADEGFIYGLLLPLYSTAEKYYIFYYIWFSALIENILHADILLDIDLLSTSAAYRRQAAQALEAYGIENIDFSDAKVGLYKKTTLKVKKMKEIEEAVQTLVLTNRPAKDIDRLDRNLHHNLNLHAKIKPHWPTPGRLKETSLPKIDIDRELIKKYKAGFKHIADEMARQHGLVREAEEKSKQKDLQLIQKDRELTQKDKQLEQKGRQLAQKDQQLLQKDAQIKRISNSKSYRVGRFILWPFILLERIIKKDKKQNGRI